MNSKASRSRLIFALCAIAPAGLSPATLRAAEDENPDLPFARALIDRGWTAVAEGVIERNLGPKGIEKDKDRFNVLRLMLLIQEAKRTSGAAPKAEALKAAFEGMDQLVGPDLKTKLEGKGAADLGEFLIDASSLVAEEARAAVSPEQTAEYQKRALRMVDAAEKVFQARLDALQAAAAASAAKEDAGDGEETEDEDGFTRASREEMDASYNLARARMQRGIVLSQKEEREKAFAVAVRSLDDFQATYSGTPLAYQAAILAGQCWNELGDYRKAASAFEGVAALLEQFRDEKGAFRVDNPIAADIIQRALYLKAQAANKAQKYNDAKIAADALIKIFPGIGRRPIGLATRIEGARALARLGKTEEARSKLEAVSKEDPEGAFGNLARVVLGEIFTVSGAEIKGGDVGPIITGLMDRGKFPEAIQTCRNIIAQLDRAPDKERAEGVPPILLWLGKVYSAMKRNREAAIAFEELMDKFPAHKVAPEAAFQAVKARLLATVAAPTSFDQAKYDEDLKRLLEKYKGTPQADSGQFIQADAAMESGDYEKAAKIYLGIPESAGMYYDSARFQAALCWWNLAVRSPTYTKAKPYYEEAEKLLKGCLEIVGKEAAGLGAERVENRAKLRVACRVKLAEVYSSPSLKKNKEALAVIENVDKEDRPDQEQIVLLTQSRVRALAALDRIDKAEEAFQLLREKQPNSRLLPQLSREVALAFERKAEEARKKGAEGEKDYKAYMTKALEYYAEWIDRAGQLKIAVSPTLLTGKGGVAMRAQAIALEVTGLPVGKDSFTDNLGKNDIPRAEWERAAKILEAAKPKRRGEEGTDWLPVAQIGRAYGFLGDWPKAREALEESLVWGGLISKTGEDKPIPSKAAYEKAPDLLDLFIDLGFAELIPAKKGEKGLARAQAIFAAAFEITQRGTCAWWKCRYGFIQALMKEGSYEQAKSQLNIYQQAPEWEGTRCDLKEQFDNLEKELAAKMGPAPDAGGGGPGQ